LRACREPVGPARRRRPRRARLRGRLALGQHLLGNLLWAAGKVEPARDQFRRARDIWAQLTDGDAPPGADAATLNAFACFLGSCPDESFRDAGRAVALARRAVDRAPALGPSWSTLGLALYRAGDPSAAVAALEKARQLRKATDAADGFVRAMACARLGEKDEARQWYDQVAGFMDRTQGGIER